MQIPHSLRRDADTAGVPVGLHLPETNEEWVWISGYNNSASAGRQIGQSVDREE